MLYRQNITAVPVVCTAPLEHNAGWALDYDFGLGKLVIFPRFPNISAIQ